MNASNLRHFAMSTALLAPLLINPAHAQSVSIVTTPAGSFSNSAAQAMAKSLSQRTKLRAVVQAQASSGFDEVETGSAEYTLSNSFDATFYASGTGEYEGRGAKDTIRMIATLIPYRTAMHVRADSEIKTIAEVKGKRISSGFNAQKTIGRIVAAHLANGGISYNDVIKVPTPNVLRSAEDFKSGKVDALFFAVGSAVIKEASAALGGLRILEVDASPTAVKRTQALLPGSYTITLKPSPMIEGLTKPTHVIAFDMVLVSSSKVSDEVAYITAKTIYENKKDLVSTFPPFGIFNPKGMAKENQGVPFHRGALRFYKEVGLIK